MPPPITQNSALASWGSAIFERSDNIIFAHNFPYYQLLTHLPTPIVQHAIRFFVAITKSYCGRDEDGE
jgi:hypothetical protein